MMNDAELLRRYVETRSEPAFTEFVGRHLNLVYFVALRSTDGNAALARDVTQAVFTLAGHRAAKLAAHPTLTGWLHTTTRQIAARTYRKERTRQRYETEAAMQHDIINSTAEHEWDRLRPVIDDALEDLAAREREALLVRFFEGRPFADMGAAWRISQDAARMRVDRALEKLRVALERRGIRSVSAALAAALSTGGGLAAPAGLVATVGSAALTTAAPAGSTSFFTIMSSTKIILSAAAVIVALLTGNAVFQHSRAETAARRADEIARELTAVRAQLARAEQRRTVAETAATEAEKDNAALLSAVQAVRAKSTAARAGSSPAGPNPPPAANDLLAKTLQPLFPNGVVATLGDRMVTVDDVRREITPLLTKLQQATTNPDDLPQRLYALQNSVIADLITRELNLKEFHNQLDGDPPKHIAAEYLDSEIANRVKDKFNNDPSALLASLAAQGITLEQYRRSVEEEIVFHYMIGQQRRLAQGQPKDGSAKPRTP